MADFIFSRQLKLMPSISAVFTGAPAAALGGGYCSLDPPQQGDWGAFPHKDYNDKNMLTDSKA